MNQFPPLRQAESFLDRIPTPVLVAGWLVALCLSSACLYWAIFGTGPTSQPAGVPTQVAQLTPTPAGPGSMPTVPVSPEPTPEGGQISPSPAPDQPTSPPSLGFGYGVQVSGLVGHPPSTCEMVRKVGANWIKQQVRWGSFAYLGPAEADMDWSGFDWLVRACSKRDIKIMFSIVTAPEWSRGGLTSSHGPPADMNEYARFVGMVVDRYKGNINAIEVWNEQNLSREWTTDPQQLSAAHYVAMLKAAYEAVKARDPNIIVISGALSPTGVDDGINAIDDFRYLQQMIDAGMLDYADCVGVHHNGYNIGPDVSSQTVMQHPKAATAQFRGPFTPFNNGPPHHSWFFYDTLQETARIVAGRKPLCVTEFGWASSEGYPDAPKGFEFAKDNTLQEQADYIVQAFDLMQQWGFVKLAFLWNLDFGPKGSGYMDDTVPYSLVSTDGLPRPAFEALERMPKPW